MITPEVLKTLLDDVHRSNDPSSDHDLNSDFIPAPGRELRAAAVLVPVQCRQDSARLILTKRSSALKHHPGQIAFPGGKMDDGDQDLFATAMREAQEEIGLAPSDVTIIGALPRHETVTGFHVVPVLAAVAPDFQPMAEPGEVDEVFDIPMVHVLNSARYSIQKRRWRGTWRHYYVVPFGPYYIWGATARMLRSMAQVSETRCE